MASWKPKPGSFEIKDQNQQRLAVTEWFFEKEPRIWTSTGMMSIKLKASNFFLL
jgi:hypothetical protein